MQTRQLAPTCGAPYLVPTCRLSPCTAAVLQSRTRSTVVARAAAAEVAAPAREVLSTQSFDHGISAELTKAGDSYELDIRALEAKPRLLHWAVNAWNLPPQAAWPQGTNQVDDKACQTPFSGGNHVRIVFPEGECPQRVVFVIKEQEPENWLNDGGVDFAVHIKAPELKEVEARVLDAEANYGNWSLFNRFCMALEVLDAADASGASGMAFFYTWLRMSQLRLLDWYRNSNYQSKDIAHVQKTLAQRCRDKAGGASDPFSRVFARLALGTLPRGGGNGDDIRMGILHIMRENGIKEGHRPGIDEKFLEQWHQKLHTNTTQEDVYICEAYLAFLHSGNMGDYWHTLWERGRITRDMMTSMDHPIHAEPMHLPHLIGPMQGYLWVLKTTHSGADLDTSMEMAKGLMDDDLRWHLFDVLNNRNEWWVPGKIAEQRHRLKHYWSAPDASRDLLLLDLALDGWFRTCVERVEKSSLGGDDLVELITLVLNNATVASESAELAQCHALWERLRGQERWGGAWNLQALAACQRTALSLSAYCDTLYSLVQPAAEAFGKACKMDEANIVNFGEEVVRGQPVFMLSVLLQNLEPLLRKAAGVSSWQVVSNAEAVGLVVEVDSLADIQGKQYDRPTIILTQEIGGNEDIPLNITAVLSPSHTDVLSHVAIRARAQGVLLASCYEDSELQALKAMAGTTISLTVAADGGIHASAAAAGAGAAAGSGGGPATKVALKRPAASNKWAVADSAYEEGTVGGKSKNLAELRSKAPDWVQVPASVCLPFGTFERVLGDAANQEVAGSLRQLQQELAAHGADMGVAPQLAAIRQLVATSLKAPAGLRQELSDTAAAAGLVAAGAWQADGEWDAMWQAICKVWASKWGDRAWLSRRACGVAEEDLVMACLVQQVVPAEYAFVMHTANPVTGDRKEMLGEMVLGLGETLVGNYPGQPLRFTSTAGQPKVISYPGKREGLFCPPGGSLIARSDSNGEDLEDFAGAGLYDSVLVTPPEHRTLDYNAEPLLWDEAACTALLQQVVKAAAEVEAAFGGAPQDIEGCWADGKLTVVQSRPQVL